VQKAGVSPNDNVPKQPYHMLGRVKKIDGGSNLLYIIVEISMGMWSGVLSY
jgi:hypothetical protein